ncbi:MAG: 4Fe-4S dicluster domain-containing protein [Planctomycetes bacterium]|nr:4Fe-4S dicluster domain-containing protein [Planctomycetota bacterium]
MLKWLVGSVLGVGGALAFYARSRFHLPALISPELKRRGLLRPPGSLPEPEFLTRCIRCQRCAQVCDTRAIRLLPGSSHLADTPVIVAEEHACNLCMRCGEACPTGAIVALTAKSEARMGTAVVDNDLCVSANGSGICGACYTACPLRGKAITQGMHLSPTVHDEFCVGCGLCEEVCIVDRDKAIRVFSERRWL